MSVAGRATYAAAVDSQRSTSAAAVSQGPVLTAWGVVRDPPQFPSAPFPEMPPTAAAAVSPVVPGAPTAAAPPDPYGRCWQNQMDAGACFPYFGTLYGSSLPPPSYRMQPGCISNIGQFWPPTPPPDGCVRYDSANNLHFCSPLTTMFRHSESLPQNMLGVHQQRLSHYSHLIDVNKDAGLKRLDACMDNVQRQKIVLPTKQSKGVQQRLCHCYECNEKTAHNLPPSINKENIVRSSDQRYVDDKLKIKACKKTKDETVGITRSTSSYHPNSSAITSFSCSVNQNTAKTMSSMQNSQAQDADIRNSQKSDATILNNNELQYEFAHSNSTSSTRCRSSSVFTVPSSNAIHPVVSTTSKCPELSRFENIDKAQQRPLPTSIPNFDAYACPTIQTSSNSQSQHDKSCCFSPPYLSSRTLYSNHHAESYAHNKTPNSFVIHGNNYNASPLKNVYFSYYESENFDLASNSNIKKHSKSNLGKQEKVSHLNYVNRGQPPEKPTAEYLVPSVASDVHTIPPGVSNSYSYHSQQKNASVPINIHASINNRQFMEESKSDGNFCNYLGTMSHKRSEKTSSSRHSSKTNSTFIKQEKTEISDCKFQKSNADTSMRIPPLPVSSAASEVLNLSTSFKCPKIEPADVQYNENTSSLVENYNSSVNPCTTSAMQNLVPTNSVSSVICKPSTAQMNYVASNYSTNILPFCDMGKTCGTQDATSLRMQRLDNQCAQVLPEDLVSVGQIAPTVEEFVILNKIPPTGSEAPTDIVPNVVDSETNDAATKSHQENIANLIAVQPMESADVSQCMPRLDKYDSPGTIKDEKEYEIKNQDQDHVANCDAPSIDNCHDEELSASEKEKEARKFIEECVETCRKNPELIDITGTIDLAEIKEEKSISPTSLDTLQEKKDESLTELSDDENCESKCVEPKNEEFEEVASKEDISSDNCVKTSTDDDKSDDYHGLYLLLQGIDQRCNTKTINEAGLNTSPDSKSVQNDECDRDFKDVTKCEPTNMKGLNLLCALVEEQLVKEFGTECKNKEETDKADTSTNLKSNYPMVEIHNRTVCKGDVEETPANGSLPTQEDATVFEMKKKLAELQQQYKEKQKELARLRPKKNNNVDVTKKNTESSLLGKDANLDSSSKSSEISSNISPNQSKLSSENVSQVTNSNTSIASKTNNADVEVSPPIKGKPIKSATPNSTSKQMEKNEDTTSANDSSSANVSLKIDISLGIRKTSKRTVRRSLVKRKLELRSSRHTITLSESNGTKLKSYKNSKSKRLKNSLLQTRQSNSTGKSSDSSLRNDEEQQPVVNGTSRSEKKIKSTKKKSTKSNENDLNGNCASKKSRTESTFDTTNESQTSANKSSKKRKAENPKKFIPSKQVRLTETIIAKQLRNRILFENSSGEKLQRKAYDVPEELFDALRKCNLGDSSLDKPSDDLTTNSQNLKEVDTDDNGSNELHSELRMTSSNLVENQRILALEDGLFYAGCIKEIQNNDSYGIVLDGQRGNKKHIFTREEMLTQTILELKPASVDELPEGTRVCAYWSHQYRCLYPGTVVKAPTPSVDWSEPRVFVEFDDGDSAQIATKNIRFLPADMQLSDDADSEASMPNLVPAIPPEECIEEKPSNKNKRKKKGIIQTSRKHGKLSKRDNSPLTNSSNCSNVPPFDLCSTKEFTPTTSHSSERDQNSNDLMDNSTKKTDKRTLGQSVSKKSTESRSKLKEISSLLEKNKKHKKYKERHKHHHHHHHHRHHHRHCHRHRHCRKHKHHKRTSATAEETSEVISVVIPSSSSIPFGDMITAKSTRNSTKDSESHNSRHSKKAKLPQTASVAHVNGIKFLESSGAGDKFSSLKTDNTDKSS